MPLEFSQYSDEQVDAVVRRILDEVGLAQSYCISIRSLVRSRAQDWRTCCGGNCNPCIGKIEEAVDRSRQVLMATGTASAVKPDEQRLGNGAPPAPASTKKSEHRAPHGSRADDDDENEDRNWGLDYV